MALSGLTLVVQTRALDRIHYALMLAVSAAALGAPTTIFFAIEGVHALEAKGLDRLETAAGEPGRAFLDRLAAAGAAAPDELIAALAELEARFAACDTGLAVAGLSAEDLRDDVPIETTGLADVLASAESGRIVYV